MDDTCPLTPNEAFAHRVLSQYHYNATARSNRGTPYEIDITRAVVRVFKTFYHAALPLHRIVAIGNVMLDSTQPEPEHYKHVLTKMVRAGIMSSYRRGGQRMWEINYNYIPPIN